MKTKMIMKAVITCGGLGTRLLPFTKELPKEMAPIFWKKSGTIQVKPLIELIFEQLYSEGIREFCFITGKTKRAIENHFTPETTETPESIKSFYDTLINSKIFWVNQFEPKGFGDAVKYASSFVGLDNFILQAGDVAIVSNNKTKTPIKQLVDISQNSKPDAVLLIRKVIDPERHGVVTIQENENGLHKVLKAVEKPEKPESDLGIMPTYLFNPLIFSALEKTQPGRNNEIQLTDAIQKLVEAGKNVVAIKIDEEKILDVGVPSSYWNALQDSHSFVTNDLK